MYIEADEMVVWPSTLVLLFFMLLFATVLESR